MKSRKFVLVALMGMLAVGAPAIADHQLKDVIIGDYVPGNEGAETVIPYQLLRDTDGNGLEDTAWIRFHVYKEGTTKLLHATTWRRVPFLALDCGKPLTFVVYFSSEYYRDAPDSSRLYWMIDGGSACGAVGEGGDRSALAFLYSADVSTAGGDVWTYGVRNRGARFELADANADLDNEVVLLTNVIHPTNWKIENRIVRVMDEDTGTLISEKVYPIVRP